MNTLRKKNNLGEGDLENPDDVPMPITAHLSELRTRLVRSLFVVFGVFLVAAVCEMELGQPILTIFRRPLETRGVPLHFLELTEPFFTYLRVGIYSSLFLTFPYVLGQLWLFVRPALYSRERQAVWPFVLLSYPLFVGGGLFGYFMVLPIGYDFFLSFENEITLPTLSMSSYLSLTIHLLFAFGLVFELPTIAFILTRIGMINAGWLRKNRKYALVVIFIAAAILTPPDIFTQTLMAGPLIILYEISVFVSWMARSREVPTSSPEGSAA